MVQISKNPLVLIDGSSYFYRSYYAFPFLKNSVGEPTGAIYGTLNMLYSLILQYQPIYAAVVFDTKNRNFRHKLFSQYKSNRVSMPDNLQRQIQPLYMMIKAMGLPLLTISGIEADDIIGSLAHEAKKIEYPVLISTHDKDMIQLVSSEVTIINTMNNSIFGPEEVIDKYGFPPELIVDFLALMGDPSDNIPGVPGIGEKIAKILVKKIGGLDKLYAQSEKIADLTFRGAKKIAKEIERNREIAYLSYQLVKIKTDFNLGITFEQLKIQPPSIQELLELFHKYEFQRFITDIKTGKFLKSSDFRSITDIKNTEHMDSIDNLIEEKKTDYISSSDYDCYEIIFNDIQLSEWFKKIKKESIFSFSTEVENLDDIFTKLIGFSFSISPGIGVYIPIVHNDLTIQKNLSYSRIFEFLKLILEDEKISKIGQNLKNDLNVFQNYGIVLRGVVFDIILESYVLNSARNHHDIHSLAKYWLNQEIIFSNKKIIRKNKNQPSTKIVSEKSAFYVTKKADIILQLHKKIWPELQKYQGLLNIFQNFEIPLISVLSRIERNGVKINSKLLQKQSEKLVLKLKKLEEKAYKINGEPFNLSSTKQLQKILFKKQGIKPLKKTPCGAISTSEKVLEELIMLNCPLSKIILNYRELAKLKSTYTDKLPLMVNKKTGRIHTSYHQEVTTTGRLSSTNPNLQNIPIRSEEGKRIRQAFVAEKNHILISADYSQIELRIMAHISRDKSLMKAFIEGKDIHCTTASEIFDLPLENITKEHRYIAKSINFGLIYGMSAFGLSRQLNISYKESQRYINLYFERYSGVLNYMKHICIQARKKGYVETVNGRRLYLPDIQGKNFIRRASAERIAINAPIQGTAADIIKKAMITIDSWLKDEKPFVQLIMQVHDELVFEVHKKDMEISLKKIHDFMKNSAKLDVPLLVKIRRGKNWSQFH